MEILRRKIIISILWIIEAAGWAAGMFLFMLQPGEINSLSGGKLLGQPLGDNLSWWIASFWFIPLIMAFIVFVLSNKVCRWLNFVSGIVIAAYLAVAGVLHMMAGRSAVILMDYLLGAIAGILIAFYAFRLTRRVK